MTAPKQSYAAWNGGIGTEKTSEWQFLNGKRMGAMDFCNKRILDLGVHIFSEHIQMGSWA